MPRYVDADDFIHWQKKLICDKCYKRFEDDQNGEMQEFYSIGDRPCRGCGVLDTLYALDDYAGHHSIKEMTNADILKPCPFCGGEAQLTEFCGDWRVVCIECNASVDDFFEGDNPRQEAINAWNRRTKIETVLFDQEETIEGCTVQILTNSATGEQSVGWWRGKKEDMPQ